MFPHVISVDLIYEKKGINANPRPQAEKYIAQGYVWQLADRFPAKEWPACYQWHKWQGWEGPCGF